MRVYVPILWLFGIWYSHLVGMFLGHLAYSVVVLVCCTNRNLATLIRAEVGVISSFATQNESLYLDLNPEYKN
jgi:hypothetical protein